MNAVQFVGLQRENGKTQLEERSTMNKSRHTVAIAAFLVLYAGIALVTALHAQATLPETMFLACFFGAALITAAGLLRRSWIARPVAIVLLVLAAFSSLPDLLLMSLAAIGSGSIPLAAAGPLLVHASIFLAAAIAVWWLTGAQARSHLARVQPHTGERHV
jgi:hypothetical protein